MADKIDISAIARVIDQASGPLRGITGSINKAGLAAKGTSQSFVRLNAFKFGGLTAGVRAIGTSVTGLVGSLTRMAGPLLALGGVAGFGGVVAGMKQFINTADELAKRAKIMGTTAENLQGFRHAAKLAGVDTGVADKALQGLIRTLGKVASGEKAATKAAGPYLQAMGITPAEIKKAFAENDLEPILRRVAAGFEINTDASKRMVASEKLMTKAGRESINIWAQGADALAAAFAEGKKLAGITNQNAKDAEAAADALTRFEASVTGLKNSIYAEFLPVIKPAADALRMFVQDNREIIKIEITKFFTKLGEALKSIDWGKVWRGIKQIGGAIETVVGLVGGWENAILGLILIMNTKLRTAALGAVQSFAGIGLQMAGLSPALLNPITAAVIGLAVAGFLIYQNWGTIGPWIDEQMNTVKRAITSAADAAEDWANSIVPKEVQDAWKETADEIGMAMTPVKKGLEDSGKSLDDWLGHIDRAFAGLGPKYDQAISALGNFFKRFAPTEDTGSPLDDWLGGIDQGFEALGPWYDTALTDLGNFLDEFAWQPLKETWAGIGEWFGNTWAGVKEKFWGAVDWVKQFASDFIPEPIKTAWNALGGWFDTMWQGVVAAFQWAWGIIKPIIDAVAAGAGVIKGAAGWVGGKIGGAWDFLSNLGGAPAAEPGAQPIGVPATAAAAAAAPAAPPGLLPRARAAGVTGGGGGEVRAKLDGEIESRLKVDLDPDLKATLKESKTRGPVRNDVEVGRSMASSYATW